MAAALVRVRPVTFGRVLGETGAIFEYLEEKHPKPPLVGTTAEERAETRQWQRRIELKITENLYNAFRFSEGIELFDRVSGRPSAAASLHPLSTVIGSAG